MRNQLGRIPWFPPFANPSLQADFCADDITGRHMSIQSFYIYLFIHLSIFVFTYCMSKKSWPISHILSIDDGSGLLGQAVHRQIGNQIIYQAYEIKPNDIDLVTVLSLIEHIETSYYISSKHVLECYVYVIHFIQSEWNLWMSG